MCISIIHITFIIDLSEKSIRDFLKIKIQFFKLNK